MEPVVVYSNNTCPNCDNLKKALSFKGVPYQEVNISEQPEQAVMIRERGFRSLPVINDNGNWMTGFTPSNLLSIITPRVTPAAVVA